MRPKVSSSNIRLSKLLNQLSIKGDEQNSSGSGSSIKRNYTNNKKTNESSSSLVAIDILPSGIAVMKLQNPPVNSLPPQMLEAIDRAVMQLEDNSKVTAVIVTGQNLFFSGGADIKVLQALSKDNEATNAFAAKANKLLNKIESSKKPYIAAINGYALGGGCELAMACVHRIMARNENIKIGLVEISLGLIPGFGGTQRLPRLIGFEKGIEAILHGTTYSPSEALQIGLINEVVNSGDLLTRAEQIALELSSGKQKSMKSLYYTDRIPNKAKGEQLINKIRRNRLKTFIRMPAGEYVLRACAGILEGPTEGLAAEFEEFTKVLSTPEARAQMHLFFAKTNAAKISDLPKPHTQINKVGIVGGGTMGSGIAAALLSKGISVIVKEVSKPAVVGALKRIKAHLTELQERNLLKTDIEALIKQALTVQADYNKFDTVDLVIEAALEHLTLKQSIMRDLYRVCNHRCIFATGTATLSIDDIANRLPHDGNNRVIGMHFFAPAHLLNIVEIVSGRYLNPQILADILAFCKRIDKIGVPVKDGAGFVTNRMFYPYRQAADFLIEHGVDPYRIDRALEQFGMAAGVNRMTDIAGIDVFYQGQESMRRAYGAQMYASSLLKELSDRRRYGEKAGAGFYRYDEFNHPSTDYNGLDDVLESVRAQKTKIQYELSDEEIVQMLLFPVVNECFRIISEGKIDKKSDLDVLSCQGYGFPTKYGGVYYWAEQVGFAEIAQKLEKWAMLYSQGESDYNVQAFFSPCDVLLNLCVGKGRKERIPGSSLSSEEEEEEEEE